jgi:hypothetical protein
MNVTAQEKSALYELSWSLSAASPSDPLKLSYEIAALEELFVSDRLWDYGPSRTRIPDPFGVYRYVRDGSLRLVFAQAPYPPNVMPHVVYQPLYSRIAAGESRKVELLLQQPVDEYSSLARDITAPTVLEEVSKVILVMGYRARSTMEADPMPPPKESAEEAGYIVHDPKYMVSTLEVGALPVKRRSGYMARFALAGEPAPGPMPMDPPRASK